VLNMEMIMIERIVGSPSLPKTRSATAPKTNWLPAISFMGEDVQSHQIEQEINPHHGKRRCRKWRGECSAGIAHFFAEIETPPNRRQCRRRLQSENKGDDERPSSWYGVGEPQLRREQRAGRACAPE